MNKPQSVPLKLHNESFHSISLAFRKLLDRVASAQVRSSTSNIKSTKRSSIGSLYTEKFSKKRKTQLHSSIRKNSYISQNIFDSKVRCKTQMDNKQKSKMQFSNGFNLSSCKDRSKSNPSISNCKDIYNKINQYNGLLITKTYIFDQGTTYGTQKRTLKSPFRKHTNSSNQKRQKCLFLDQQNTTYQSRIKGNQKRRKLQQKFKNIQQFKAKNKFFKIGDFEPWQTEKGEQYCFIDE